VDRDHTQFMGGDGTKDRKDGGSLDGAGERVAGVGGDGVNHWLLP